MAVLGARVVAFDFSAPFIECARKRTVEFAEQIEYRVLDATNLDGLLSLGEGRFDAAVCTMAIMDMEEIEPIAKTLRRLLKPSGRFIFSVMHPCFNNMGCRMSIEEEDRDGEIRTVRSVKVVRYMTPFSARGIGIVGQPVPQTYFHRPLQALLEPFLRNGLVVDGLEEAAFTDPSGARGPLSWDHFAEIPPVLIVRLRLV
ncbi:class I SAM-dependent methyltransferase [Candidatus Bipolaricaulota bacterium]